METASTWEPVSLLWPLGPTGHFHCHVVGLFLGSSFARVWMRRTLLALQSQTWGGPGLGVRLSQFNPQQCHLPAMGPWWVIQPLCAPSFSSVKWAITRPFSRNVSHGPWKADHLMPGQVSSVILATMVLLRPMPIYHPDHCADDSTAPTPTTPPATSRLAGQGTSSECKRLEFIFPGPLLLGPLTLDPCQPHPLVFLELSPSLASSAERRAG